MSIVSKLRAEHEQARQTVHGLCVALAEGKQVKDADLTKAREAASMSPLEVAKLIETLEARKAAHDEYHAVDYAAEQAANIQERRELAPKIEAEQKKLADLRERLQAMHDRVSSLTKQHSGLDDKQREAFNKKTATLAATGDRNDWKVVEG